MMDELEQPTDNGFDEADDTFTESLAGDEANGIRIDEDAIREFATMEPGEDHVCIWGTTQSGKTSFLVSLYYVLGNINHGVDLNLTMIHNNEAAMRWLDMVFQPMATFGVFPDATAVTTSTYTYSDIAMPKFTITRPGSNQTIKLTFLDAPGEAFRDPETFAAKYRVTNPIDYLRRCKGLIMLVDASLGRLDPREEIVALNRNIRSIMIDPETKEADPIQFPVAFCLTKCDEPVRRGAIEDIATFIQDNPKFRNFNGTLGANFAENKTKWFGTSAIGYEPGKPSQLFYRWDGKLGIQHPETMVPINVGEALKWVLEEAGLII